MCCFEVCKTSKLPKGTFYVLFASTKRTKSSRRAAALSTPGERFKTLQNSFFVLLPSFVPKPACGATRFSDVLNRCERVIVVQTQDRYFPKLGCRTASSQGHVTFKKGSCSLSLLRWVFVFAVYSLRILHKNQNSIFLRKFRSLKKVSHSHNPIASLSQSVITYCHQKNSLRVHTKPYILFY